MPTPGLTALDQEREGSMADEGGTSGAVMETQDDGECVTDCEPTSHRPHARPTFGSAPRERVHARRRVWLGVAIVAGLALTVAGVVMVAQRSTA